MTRLTSGRHGNRLAKHINPIALLPLLLLPPCVPAIYFVFMSSFPFISFFTCLAVVVVFFDFKATALIDGALELV